MSVGHQRPVHTQRPDLILDDGDLVAGIPRDEPMSRRAVFSTSKCQARLRPSRRLAFSRASLGKYQGIQCATSSGFVQTPQALRLRPSSLHRESRSGSSPAPAGQNVSLLLLATEGKGILQQPNSRNPTLPSDTFAPQSHPFAFLQARRSSRCWWLAYDGWICAAITGLCMPETSSWALKVLLGSTAPRGSPGGDR